MPNIIEISDCVGSADIQQGTFTTPGFDSIRDEFTDEYIYKLLGVTLGELFLADLDVNGVPQTAPYTTIYEPIKQDLNNGQVLYSKGIKYYITQIIWYYYVRNNNLEVSLSGNNNSLSENSSNDVDPSVLTKNFNKAITTGEAIQYYINDNSSTFPDYNGQHLDRLIAL